MLTWTLAGPSVRSSLSDLTKTRFLLVCKSFGVSLCPPCSLLLRLSALTPQPSLGQISSSLVVSFLLRSGHVRVSGFLLHASELGEESKCELSAQPQHATASLPCSESMVLDHVFTWKTSHFLEGSLQSQIVTAWALGTARPGHGASL